MAVPQYRPVDRLGDVGDPGTSFKNPDQAKYLQGLLANLRRNFDDFVGRTTAVPNVRLLSPGGKSYDVTVSDDGVISATLVR